MGVHTSRWATTTTTTKKKWEKLESRLSCFSQFIAEESCALCRACPIPYERIVVVPALHVILLGTCSTDVVVLLFEGCCDEVLTLLILRIIACPLTNQKKSKSIHHHLLRPTHARPALRCYRACSRSSRSCSTRACLMSSLTRPPRSSCSSPR
jgi:hypothetical protein